MCGSKNQLFLDLLEAKAFPNQETVGQNPHRRVTAIFILGANGQ